MSDDFGKVLFTAQDADGQDVWLVRFWTGHWGILVDGRCQAIGWPNGELGPATKAYREFIAVQPRVKLESQCMSP